MVSDYNAPHQGEQGTARCRLPLHQSGLRGNIIRFDAPLCLRPFHPVSFLFRPEAMSVAACILTKPSQAGSSVI